MKLWVYLAAYQLYEKKLWVLFDTTFIASFRLRKVLENAVLRPSRGDFPAPVQSRGTRLVLTYLKIVFST